jgi:hypothetical protein
VLPQGVEARLEVSAVSGEPRPQREQHAAWNNAAAVQDVADVTDACVPGDRHLNGIAALRCEGLDECPEERQQGDPGRDHSQPAQPALSHRRALR